MHSTWNDAIRHIAYDWHLEAKWLDDWDQLDTIERQREWLKKDLIIDIHDVWKDSTHGPDASLAYRNMAWAAAAHLGQDPCFPYDPDQAQAVVDSVVDVVIQRHHKYGTGNILDATFLGIIIRMGDKINRIKNNAGDFEDETMEDAWADIIGYALIAEMLMRGTFHLPLAG